MLSIIMGVALYGGLLKLGAYMNVKTSENIKKIQEMNEEEREELRKIVERIPFK